MKALVLEDIGRLVYRDFPTPTPQSGEVLLHIKAGTIVLVGNPDGVKNLNRKVYNLDRLNELRFVIR